MLTAITIVAAVVAITGYVCLCMKAGFMVADLTEDTGFDAGFYLMTVFGLVALPVAIIIGFFA